MRTIVTLIMLGGLCLNTIAQVPQKMSYQAVIRDATGSLVKNTTVGMRITILEGALPGTEVYTETQTPVTNANGLVTLEIGGGVGFDTIRWGNGNHYIKTETDPAGGTSYTISGTSQLLGVPYALYAKTSSDAVKLTGDQVITGNKTFTDTINANNINIINVADPVNVQDAATKAYVDALKSLVQELQAEVGVKDVDGNAYKSVKIGDQVWMAENLKTTKYKDGTVIPLVTDNTAWSLLTTPGYSWYANDQAAYGNTYGALYNWYTANTGKLCPSGWHAPSDAEWTTLTTFLGGESVAGGKLKSTTGWDSPNTGATNTSGFSGLPGGYRHADGTFSGAGGYGNWWSLTEGSVTGPWHRGLYYFDDNLWRIEYPKILGFSIRCVRDAVLSVTTAAPDSVKYNSAFLGGEVTSGGGLAVTERGVCYATTQNPTTGNTKVVMGSGTGIFNNKVTGLTANTTYYVRAYAINSQGTAYGEQVSFITDFENCGIISDVDGNTYKTVQIGTQCWMRENLKTTKYNDGTNIPNITDGSAWLALTTGAYCWYNNDINNKGTYGALYNWHTVNTGKLCPTGWHVPSDAEWTMLSNSLGGPSVAGGKMKSTTGWYSPNTGGTNESGFSGLPGGGRYVDGIFYNKDYVGYWCSTTEYSANNAWGRYLLYNYTYVNREAFDKVNGGSIRCVRDL